MGRTAGKRTGTRILKVSRETPDPGFMWSGENRDDGLMDTVTVLGFIAGTLTTLSFAPQVARAWRTRSTDDLSLAMLVVFLAGVVLWLAYGVVKGDIAIVASNAVTAVLIGLILSLKTKDE